MIILTNEILKDKSKFKSIIENEKNIVSLAIISQNKLKHMLLDAMQRFASSTTNVNQEDSENVIKLLNECKSSLDLSNTNIIALEDLINQFDTILKKEDTILDDINNLSDNYLKTNEDVLNNTLKIERTLTSLPFLDCVYINTTENNLEETSKEDTTFSIDGSNYVENTLIISEIKGKVFLPYTFSCLNETLKNNPSKYSSIEDVIKKDYILPYKLFKNPIIARFKEAFKLMRLKENESIKKSFDLGMELLLNYNLHPAIISACKNLDELDIYLDYLDSNKTDNFKCFDIKFEIAPKVVKK